MTKLIAGLVIAAAITLGGAPVAAADGGSVPGVVSSTSDAGPASHHTFIHQNSSGDRLRDLINNFFDRIFVRIGDGR